MEQKTNNSLMHKTKKELVDIILRKDDVHKELNCKLEAYKKSYKNDLAVISVSNKQLKENIETLKNSNFVYKNKLDSCNNTITNLETNIKRYNFKASIYQIFAIIELIILIVYICVNIG